MSIRLDRYVGPEAIRVRSISAPGGTPIDSQEALRAWLDGKDVSGSVGQVAAKFVIDPEGILWLADRRSKHVACTAGRRFLSAGEMFFSTRGEMIFEEVSNLSTGYCPAPESWGAVGQALDEIGGDQPGRFTTDIIFRWCPGCVERNVVKDAWFACGVCGGDLPELWNFEAD